MSEPLSRRALNRATLARQLLLARSDLSTPDALEHLVGLQAQTPHSWYGGLWCRLTSFAPDGLGALLEARQVVRLGLMRGTIHLVTARDCLALRPLFQPIMDRILTGSFGRHLRDLDLERVTSVGRALLEETPMTFSELGRALSVEFPGRDAPSLAQVLRARETLVQVPPRGVWGRSGTAKHTTASSWLDLDVPPATIDDLVLRYLAAFGPATVRDAQTWSGLTRLGEVFERLPLVRFSPPDGGPDLFDAPEAPRPHPDTPAPARYLYDFDNLLLSHADRSRVITDGYLGQGFTEHGPMPRCFLLDGFTAGTWSVSSSRGSARLTVQPFHRLPTPDREALAAEGEALLDFLAGTSTDRDIRFVPPGPWHALAG